MAVITRVFDFITQYQEKFNKADMVCMKVNGEWKKYSTDEFVSVSNKLSLGLVATGIQKGDRIAVMSANRPEWLFSDFGIMQIGATQMPLYPTLSEQDIKFIVNDAQTKVIFAGSEDIYLKLMKVRAELPTVQEIYTFDEVPGAKNWNILLDAGKDLDVSILKPLKDAVTADDLLTLIYTSGTTGSPKGVMLTHNNLVTNVVCCADIVPKGTHKALSFLPMSHIFERMVCYLYLELGVSIYFAESLETIVVNLNEVQPQMFTTVPRLLEKVYDRIVAKGHEAKGIKKILFFWALELGLKFEEEGKGGFWYNIQLSIARKLVFSKWRAALGGNVLGITSGGAALQPRLAKVFTAAGIPIYQGYGLTETSPVITVNCPGKNKFGTVGPVISGVEVRIAQDGEILARGPNIMKGYYNRPEATAETIIDGWFHTGDIGELDADGFLRITDRKKEIFKTAGGKYIAPQIMENKFKESTYIEQMLVLGENERFPSALIVPTFVNLKEWCSRHNIDYTTNEEMIKHSEIIALFQKELDKYNVDFGHWEQIKKFELLPREFSIDEGEMTPKLSLKRKVILEKNKSLVTRIYTE